MMKDLHADGRVACPRVEATRCRGNVIELCFDDEPRVRWKTDETCVAPLVCSEDEPGRAACVKPGLRHRIARRVGRAVIVALVKTGIVRVPSQ